MKKDLSIALILMILINSSLILSLETTSFSVDEKSYKLSLKEAFDDRADLILNGKTNTLSHVQKPTNNTGYNFQNVFPSTPEVSMVLFSSAAPERAGYASHSSLYVGVTKRLIINLTSYGPASNIVKEGKNIALSVHSVNVSRDNLFLKINEVLYPQLNEKSSGPYDLDKYESIEKIKLVLLDLKMANLDGTSAQADILIVFEINLTLEGDCELRGDCIDKTSSTEGAANINDTTVVCNKDSDCNMPSATAPYCSNEQQCIGYTNFTCVNAGSSSSYCKSSPAESCIYCDYGCKDNKCSEKPAENKEESTQSPIWWTMGAVLVVVIAISISYFIIKRRKENEFLSY